MVKIAGRDISLGVDLHVFRITDDENIYPLRRKARARILVLRLGNSKRGSGRPRHDFQSRCLAEGF